MTRYSWVAPLVFLFGLFILALVFSAGLSYWGPLAPDWDLQTLYSHVPQVSILEYGQFPLWDPFHCGGLSLIGNPQARFLSPLFFLHLILPTIIALKIECILHTWIAMFSFWLLGKRFSTRLWPPIFGGLLYGLNGAFQFRIAGAHFTFLSFSLAPLFLHFLLDADRSRKAFALSVLILLLMTFDGLTYPVPFTLFAFGIHGVSQGLLSKSWQYLKAFLQVTLVSLSLGAIKIIPSLETVTLFPRGMSSTDRLTLPLLYEIFLRRNQGFMGGIPFVQWKSMSNLTASWWGEYGCYLGLLPVLFVIMGLIFSEKRHRPLWITLLALFAFYLGDYGRFSPWHLLHSVPPFHTHEFSSRFIFPILIFVSIFAVLGLDALENKVLIRVPTITARTAWLIGAGIVLVAVMDLQSESTLPLSQQKFQTSDSRRPGRPFLQSINSRSLSMHAAAWNVGTINCYESLFPEGSRSSVMGVNEKGYQGEAYLKSASGKVDTLQWSPNQMEYHVELARPDRFIVNQNYYPGWQTSLGSISNERDLLSVDLPAGDHNLKLHYRPASLQGGVGISLLGLLLLGIMLRQVSVKVRILSVAALVSAWILVCATALPNSRLWAPEKKIHKARILPPLYLSTLAGILEFEGDTRSAAEAKEMAKMGAGEWEFVDQVYETTLRNLQLRRTDPIAK
jgi:hypothetical protein